MISPITANSDGWSCSGPRVNQRAAPWAVLPTAKTPKQGQDGDDVDGRGQRLEPPVVEERHRDHHDHPDDDEQGLLLQVGVGVLPAGQELAPGGRVDHHHADQGDQDRRDGQDDIEDGTASRARATDLAVIVMWREWAIGASRSRGRLHVVAILTRPACATSVASVASVRNRSACGRQREHPARPLTWADLHPETRALPHRPC